MKRLREVEKDRLRTAGAVNGWMGVLVFMLLNALAATLSDQGLSL